MLIFLAQAPPAPGTPGKDNETLKDVAAKAADSAKSKPGAPAEKDKAGDAKAGDAKAGDSAKSEVGKTGEAQTGTKTEAPKEDPWYYHGAMRWMIDGGIFMWPIFFLGVLAAGVIIERYRSLRMLRTDNDGLRRQVRDLLQQDKAEEALEMVDREQGPVPAILGSGLRKYVVLRRLGSDAGRIEEQVIKAMEDYSVHIVAALERHLPILATVSSVAPMIGFLGTVQGMILSFDDIVASIGQKNIVELAAAGIKVALLTTCLGLIVGIPAFAAYNYFTGVINRFVLDVEETSTELIETVTLHTALSAKEHEEAAAR